MALRLGSTEVSSLRLGTVTPSKVMLGDVQVWPAAGGPTIGMVTITGIILPPEPPAFDPDAAVWIAGVEAADGQALEEGVKQAMNTLVATLKSQVGLWDNIEIFAPLAGPRTLAGCMVPLKGTAAFTAVNATSGDYSRTTGIKQKPGMTVEISADGFDIDPTTGRIGIFALTTERPQPGAGWNAALIGQEQWPDQRTTITLSVDNSTALMAIRSVNEGLPGYAINPVLSDIAFYSVQRSSATQVYYRLGDGVPVVVTQAFAATVPNLVPIALFQASGPTSIRAMCAGALETLASTGIGTVLENACKQYQRDLATAIP
jgi:hypothetical protein